MGIIYKIYNDINDKLYIGQTIQPLIRRWQSHCSDSKNTDTHLYRAMRLYGLEHFMIEPIEKDIPNGQLNEREQYWISYYDSFHNGYNSTIGGDCGNFEMTPVYQYDLDGKFIAEYSSSNDAERQTGILHQNILKTCKGVLRQTGNFLWNFEKFDALEIRPSKKEKQVAQYDANHNLLCIWDRVKDAAASIGVEPTHISRAIRRGYKCHNFYWEHIQ